MDNNEYRRIGDMFGSKPFKKEKTAIDRFLFQVFTTIAILALILFINSINLKITKTITQSIKSTLNWRIDFGGLGNYLQALGTANTKEENYNNINNISNLSSADNIKENNDKILGVNSSRFVMPLEGEITSVFGERIHPVFNTIKQHNGIDIAGEYGDDIISSMDGIVIKIDEDMDLGKFIKIKDGDYETIYGHCSKIITDEGKAVKQGEKIAEVGDTGFTSGTHLHFEIWVENNPINPLEIIK